MTRYSHDFRVVPGKSRHPRAFRDEESLWEDDLRRISRLLARHIYSVRRFEEKRKGLSNPEKIEDERPLLSIAIFGPSGSGKSSLLRTLVDRIRRQTLQRLFEEEPAAKSGGGMLGREAKSLHKLQSLPVMEPSIWSSKDHFLYAFLAAALEEDRRKLDDRDRDPDAHPTQGLSPVQMRFQTVNEYLRVIDDDHGRSEYDPLGTSLQNLERHTSGLRLKSALRKFIEVLANQLGEEDSVLLLPVDDIDMAPDHMVDALQSYQSYLLHPQLVPVFTFTDRLPEELLRVHFDRQLRQNHDTRRVQSSLEEMNRRLAIGEQLGVQFLSRCFPVRNRIRLGPAPGRVQRAALAARPRGDEMAAESSPPDQLPVSVLLTTTSFLLFGHPDREAAHSVRATLRPSTLRRQIQVVDAISDLKLDSFIETQFVDLAGASVKNVRSALREGVTAPDEGPVPLSEEVTALRKKTAKQLDEAYGKLDEILKNRFGSPEYSWARIFSRASWSIFNVHRDTLRELNLHLEDLYSWSPKELRTVVLDTVLQQNRATRRLILDRWFNRTDFRRSQVLSLLAVNAFKPWMLGEEPYGDELRPLQTLLKEEDRPKDLPTSLLAEADRYSFPATKGIPWFVNGLIGFYLPQVLSRNWADATTREMRVNERMSGNGWDLHLGPVNAVKIADYKKNMFTWGMMFLNREGYRKSLSLEEEFFPRRLKMSDGIWVEKNDEKNDGKNEAKLRLVDEKGDDIAREAYQASKWKGVDKTLEKLERITSQTCGGWAAIPKRFRQILLLRIWTVQGYSRGRYWAALSFWRGLGLIGQVAELGLKYDLDPGPVEKASEIIVALAKSAESNEEYLDSSGQKTTPEGIKKYARECGERLESKIETLFRDGAVDEAALGVDKDERVELSDVWNEVIGMIRAHCLAGIIPGSLLAHGSEESSLAMAFPRWDPKVMNVAICKLAADVLRWLTKLGDFRLHPMPAPGCRIAWRECFLRRIHGEYILGSLWPRMNAEYIQDQWRESRGNMDDRILRAGLRADCIRDPQGEDKGRWNAHTAMEAWVEAFLEYWRGCRPMMEAWLSCPLFLVPEKLEEELDRSPKRETNVGNEECKRLKELGMYPSRDVTRFKGVHAKKIPLSFAIERARPDEFFVRTPELVEVSTGARPIKVTQVNPAKDP